jgi:predicted esterase
MARSAGLGIVIFAAVALVALVAPGGRARAADKPSNKPPPPFCAPDPEIEALGTGRGGVPEADICYLDGTAGRADAGRRTLVIFLHGAIARNTTWSWNHERGLLRLARGANVEVLFPRSPESAPGFVWPGHAEPDVEQAILDRWSAAKKELEDRRGRPFDEVFIIGFSSGAYFASSLAMRGRADVDGYAVFAGGQPGVRPAAPQVRFAPVFVGVCADDATSAAHSRAFAGSLVAAGIPRTVDEEHVGHGLSHVHFYRALAYLRRMKHKA